MGIRSAYPGFCCAIKQKQEGRKHFHLHIPESRIWTELSRILKKVYDSIEKRMFLEVTQFAYVIQD